MEIKGAWGIVRLLSSVSIPENEKEGCMFTLRRLADVGHALAFQGNKFNKMEIKRGSRKIWEIKPTSNVRLFGEFRGNVFIIAYGMIKQRPIRKKFSAWHKPKNHSTRFG